jgi:hypothetical protein
MPECAFAELDRVVRKCLLSSLNSFADVVVFVVVVNREREVLPGMMRDVLCALAAVPRKSFCDAE